MGREAKVRKVVHPVSDNLFQSLIGVRPSELKRRRRRQSMSRQESRSGSCVGFERVIDIRNEDSTDHPHVLGRQQSGERRGLSEYLGEV